MREKASAVHMGEFEAAIELANAVLDKADQFGGVDPDGDLAVLSRQLLRSVERERSNFLEILRAECSQGMITPTKEPETTREVKGKVAE